LLSAGCCAIVCRVLFLEHQPSFQHRQLVPWSIFRHRLSPVFAGYILCLRSPNLQAPVCFVGTASSVSLLHKSSEPIRFTILLIPIRIPDTRIGFHLLPIPSIQAILPFFTVLFTGKVQFGG
jgi:hypothetical protein